MIQSELDFPVAFPSWLPGETLYSIVSRYHALSGNRLPSTTCKALFGHYRQGSLHDFPSRLAYFCDKTRQHCERPATIAITKTVLPFYFPLRGPRQVQDALDIATGNPIGMLKFRLGILTSRFGASHPLKACSMCMAADLQSHGLAYWHLDHQYPGIWICPRHRVALQELVVRTNGIERYGWLLPSHDQLSLLPTKKASECSLDALYHFAEFVLGWVNLTGDICLSVESLSRLYQSVLRERGFSPKPGKAMVALSRAYCTACLPLRTVRELLALPSSDKEASYQIARWVYSPRGNTHPLRHLSILHWLFPDFSSFLAMYRQVISNQQPEMEPSPITASPTDPRKLHLIGLIQAGKSATAGARAVGVSVSTAIAWAAQAGLRVKQRPKVLKVAKRTQIIVDLGTGISKAEVAKRYSTSLATITRILQSEIGLKKTWHDARQKLARDHSRQEWLSLLDEHGGDGIGVVRSLSPNTFAWLYRNDREWLRSQSAPLRSPQEGKVRRRVDWDARDKALSDEVIETALVIKGGCDSSHVSKRQIFQALPGLSAKRSILRRLPMTCRALQKVSGDT